MSEKGKLLVDGVRVCVYICAQCDGGPMPLRKVELNLKEKEKEEN